MHYHFIHIAPFPSTPYMKNVTMYYALKVHEASNMKQKTRHGYLDHSPSQVPHRDYFLSPFN